MKRFKWSINLDDESEVDHFLDLYGHMKGAELSRALDFKGPGAPSAATALVKYARHKRSAFASRTVGDIQKAIEKEKLCDRIYQLEINPAIDCW